MDDEDAVKFETAKRLLQECFDGFGAYIHGRKMKRKDRDKLRANIADFLLGRKIKV